MPTELFFCAALHLGLTNSNCSPFIGPNPAEVGPIAIERLGGVNKVAEGVWNCAVCSHATTGTGRGERKGALRVNGKAIWFRHTTGRNIRLYPSYLTLNYCSVGNQSQQKLGRVWPNEPPCRERAAIVCQVRGFLLII